MSQYLSVVIPVYNSYNSLDELYKRLTKTLHLKISSYEIIMVDDGSQDDSFAKMLELRKKDERIKLIGLTKNFGQQNALMCGFHYCSGKYIVTIDDDLQHSPHDILNLLTEIKKGYDIVYGIPTGRQQLFYRRWGSYLTDKVFNLITNKSSDIRVSSFRILNKKLLKEIIKDKRSFVYLSAIILNKTDNIANIKIEHEDRKYGDSNYNIIKLIRLFLNLYIYYSQQKFLKQFRKEKAQFKIDKKLGFNNKVV
ncbi:MAG: glycosyltransferase family 2 protein [Halanaerobiales bacterium]|nr:glycosyltransferase family 2 protein [Halanaerobiales bacterium]